MISEFDCDNVCYPSYPICAQYISGVTRKIALLITYFNHETMWQFRVTKYVFVECEIVA